MKYYILLLLTPLMLFACENAYQKEIGEVESLESIVNETEKMLFSIDTSVVYKTKRQVGEDLAQLQSFGDTLDRETAFKLGDYFAGKKQLNRFTDNYQIFVQQIEFSKKQLVDLKQDLNNGLITKEKFHEYYMAEQSSVMDLNGRVNKSVGGLDKVIERLNAERDDIIQVLESLKENSEENEE